MTTTTPYTGTMMESLFATVQRAEAQAAVTFHDQKPVQVESHATRAHEFNYDTEALLGVA